LCWRCCGAKRCGGQADEDRLTARHHNPASRRSNANTTRSLVRLKPDTTSVDAGRQSAKWLARIVVGMTLRLLKQDRPPEQITFDTSSLDHETLYGRIRCPLCKWRPSASSRWFCVCEGTPEPYFEGCGTVWNTFSTRGRCPGCSHQWRWTTCLRCEQASLHVDWYEESDERRSG
jgi:hypothetical protein